VDRDRNLLFGILGVQFKKIKPSKLIDAAAAWMVDPSREPAQRLVESKVLSEEDREFIDHLVDAAVEMHDGDTTATLASLGGEDLVRDTFRGGIVLSDSGGLKSAAVFEPSSDLDEPSVVPAVQETPGRYIHQGEYGRGGMGRVLRVRDDFLSREVALKELLPALVPEAEADAAAPVQLSMPIVSRFLQEARITGQLEHPSIVPVYELGYRKNGTLYYTMKLVRGKTLKQAIKQAKTIEERIKLLPHFVDLCQAMAYAHSRGIVHRDIKPGNVMVGEFGETLLLDWGLAKLKGQQDVHADGLAKTIQALGVGDDNEIAKSAYGQAIGTPSYMPPEQAKGQLDEVDERSDIYSLGAVLYELLTGRPPFTGKDVQTVLKKVIEVKPTAITSIEPGAPPELAAICAKAIQKSKSNRYTSARLLAEEVLRFQSGALVHAHEYTTGELIRRFIGKHRAAIAATVATLSILIVGSVVAYLRVIDERDRATQQAYQASVLLAQAQTERGQLPQALSILDSCFEPLRHWEWGRLQYECRHHIWATLRGHTGGVTSVAFSPNGEQLLTGSMDKTIRVWNANLGSESQILTGHTDGVLSVVFSPDGQRVFSGSLDATAKLWDVGSGRELRTLRGHTGGVSSVAFSWFGQRVVTGSADTTAKVWNIDSGEALLTLTGHENGVRSVVFSPDGEQLLTGSMDTTAKLWDADSGEALLTLTGHTDPVLSVAFSLDGRRLLTGSWDGTARLWDAKSGEEQLVLKGHEGAVLSVAFGPEGRRILTGSSDGTAKLWDAESGEELRSVIDHANAVSSVAFSADGKQIFTGSADKTAKVCDTEPDNRPLALMGHEGIVRSVAFSPDGRRVVTGSADTTAKVWDARLGKELLTLTGHGDVVRSVAFGPDSRRVVTGSADMTAKVWNAESGDEQFTLTGHTDGVSSVAFSPDGQWIVTGSDDKDKTVKVWNAKTGRIRITLAGHALSVSSVAFSPDSSRILTGSRDNSAKLWDAQTGTVLATLSGHADGVSSVAFSPDGLRVLTGSLDRDAKLWDAETGEELVTLIGHAKGVTSVAFSPDGRRVLTGSENDTAKVWDTDSGRELLTLTVHGGGVTSVAFSPDERWVLTGSRGKTALLWDSMPWTAETQPGDSSMSLDMRLEIWNRECIAERLAANLETAGK